LGKQEYHAIKVFKTLRLGADILGLCVGILCLSTLALQAQTRQLIDRAQVIGGSGTNCPAVFFNFSVPLTYISHFSSNKGKVLSIRLRSDFDATKGFPDADLGIRSGLDIPGLGVVIVDMSSTIITPILNMRFTQPVIAQVTQSGESSIVVSGLTSIGSNACGVTSHDTNTLQEPIDLDIATIGLPDRLSPGDIATLPIDAEIDEVELTFANARIAITAGEYSQATQLLTKLIGMPDHARSADAQELLGVVRERNGQLAHAKAEYEIYLEKYPNGEAADRVRQRLAAILTAESESPKKLRDAGTGYDGPTDQVSTIRSIPRRSDRYRGANETELPPEKSTFSATVSSFYYFNQGSTRFSEFEIGTVDQDEEVFQNSIVTTLDASGTYDTEGYKLSWRVAGDHEYDFNAIDKNKLRFSRLYGDIESKESGIAFRFGRQTRYDGGIFGRFDGAMLTYPITEIMTSKFIIGKNVDSTADDLFVADEIIFGASLHFDDILDGVDTSIYFFQQNVGSYTDRQAIGFDAQYLNNNTSIFALLDYDLTFGRIGTARISGTHIFADQSSLTLSADITHSPYLTLSNALQGQTATTLDELRATFSLDEIEQLALDRTTTTKSFTSAYSKPLNEKWRFSIDGSLFSTSGNPASGGVAAVPSPGLEFYTSAQFVGTGIFTDTDVVSAALRLADTAQSKLVQLDMYRRFNVSDKLRLKPRAKIGYRDLTTADGQELFLIPSLTANYKLNKTTDFEVEIGGRISSLETPVYKEERNEFYIFAGFWKEF